MVHIGHMDHWKIVIWSSRLCVVVLLSWRKQFRISKFYDEVWDGALPFASFCSLQPVSPDRS
jgi:hypothetical protein